eukprot:580649-Pleurochrysis_carterae.AAC.2
MPATTRSMILREQQRAKKPKRSTGPPRPRAMSANAVLLPKTQRMRPKGGAKTDLGALMTNPYTVKLGRTTVAQFPARMKTATRELRRKKLKAMEGMPHPKGGTRLERMRMKQALKRQIGRLAETVPMMQLRAIFKTMRTGVFRPGFLKGTGSTNMKDSASRMRYILGKQGDRLKARARTGIKAKKLSDLRDFLKEVRQYRTNINAGIDAGTLSPTSLARIFKEQGLSGYSDSQMRKIAQQVIMDRRAAAQ